MPRLLVFAISEKCITSKDDDTNSLITLVTGLAINVRLGETVPEETVAPVNLAATALWLRLPEDEGKRFESKVELIAPNGELNGVGTGTFELLKKSATTKVLFPVFPVGLPGIYQMRLSFREATETEWTLSSEYPLELEHRTVQMDQVAE